MLVVLLAAFVTITIVVLSSPQLDRLLELLWLKIQIILGG